MADSATRRFLACVLKLRDDMLRAADHDAFLTNLAQRIPRARPRRIREDRGAVEFIRAVRNVQREGGSWPAAHARQVYITHHETDMEYDRQRRACLAELGQLPASAHVLPLIGQVDAALGVFLDSELRRSEGEPGIASAVWNLNDAWNVVEAEVLPLVEGEPTKSADFPSYDPAAMMGCSDLADKFDVSKDALKTRLARWRRDHDEGWIEIETDQQNLPRILYRVGAVIDLIRGMRGLTALARG